MSFMYFHFKLQMNLCLGKKTHILRSIDILFLALFTFYNVITPRKRQHVKFPITDGFEGMNDLDPSLRARRPWRSSNKWGRGTNKEARDFGLRNHQRHTSPTSRLHQEPPLLQSIYGFWQLGIAFPSHMSVALDTSVSRVVTEVDNCLFRGQFVLLKGRSHIAFLEKMFNTLLWNDCLASTWTDG